MARKIQNSHTQNPHRCAGHQLWHAVIKSEQSTRKIELARTQIKSTVGIQEMSVEKVFQKKGGGAHALITRVDSNIVPKNQQIEPGAITFVYYPRPQHMAAFRKGSTGLKNGAPGKTYIGAVGSLKIGISKIGNQKMYQIHYLQGHTKSGARYCPSRALTAKYGGWRTRLLEAAFAEAEKKQLPLLLVEPILRPKSNESPAVEKRIEIFKETAQKCGFKVAEKDPCIWPIHFYIAKK
ncbi:MAG: hypothetical protein WCI04_05000 [archaeon]